MESEGKKIELEFHQNQTVQVFQMFKYLYFLRIIYSESSFQFSFL